MRASAIAVAALFVRLGEPLGRPSVSARDTDQPFRVAFILLALVLLVPLVEALLLDRDGRRRRHRPRRPFIVRKTDDRVRVTAGRRAAGRRSRARRSHCHRLRDWSTRAGYG